MARPLRIQFPGARYHVMGRGNRGAVIFREDRDREIFLDTLSEAVEKTGWLVHAWVLMGTHYHLLLETPEPNLVQGMQWFPGTFTQRYNSYHREWGHLFQGRYKAKIIDDEDSSYFRAVADYIHLNPAEAGLLDGTSPRLHSYRWSSYPDYLKAASKRPRWLATAEVLACHQIGSDTATGRRAYEALMQEKVAWVHEEKTRKGWKREWRSYDRGWAHGSKEFRQRMSEYLAEAGGGQLKPVYDRDQKRSYGEAAASKALSEGLQALELREDELPTLKKGDLRKLLLAGWLRRHYPVSREWVSERLNMGHPSRAYEGRRLYRNPPKPLRKARKTLDRILELSG